MDGDLDTAHIPNLHQFDAIDDVPDDGTDKPSNTSGYHVDAVLAARPARADRGGRHLARLQVRGHPGDAERVPARAGHRLHLPVLDDHRADPVLHQADLRGAVRRRDHVPVQLHHPAAGRTRAATAARCSSPTRSTRSRCCRRAASCPAPTRGRTTTRSTGWPRRGRPTAASPTSVQQDAMATETAGPIYDRTTEHLGSTDVALIRMHRQLLRAAKALAAAGGDAVARPARARRRRRLPGDPRRGEGPGRRRGLARPRHRRRPGG